MLSHNTVVKARNGNKMVENVGIRLTFGAITSGSMHLIL